MKQYIDAGEGLRESGKWIPKDPANADYARALVEIEDGVAELIGEEPKRPAAKDFREAAERHILASFSVLELMDMQGRLLTAPSEELKAVLQWIEAVKAVAINGSMDFSRVGDPPFSYEETL
jgi:hypothetical protein